MRLLAASAFLFLGFALNARDIAPAVELEVPIVPASVSITLVAETEKTLTIRVKNDTLKPFVYSGYRPELPIYSIKEAPIGWCGTGVSPQTLDAGASITFQIQRGHFAAGVEEIHVAVGDATSGPIRIRQ